LGLSLRILDIPPLSLKPFLYFLWDFAIRSWNIALGVRFSCEVKSCAVKRDGVPRPEGGDVNDRSSGYGLRVGDF